MWHTFCVGYLLQISISLYVTLPNICDSSTSCDTPFAKVHRLMSPPGLVVLPISQAQVQGFLNEVADLWNIFLRSVEALQRPSFGPSARTLGPKHSQLRTALSKVNWVAFANAWKVVITIEPCTTSKQTTYAYVIGTTQDRKPYFPGLPAGQR